MVPRVRRRLFLVAVALVLVAWYGYMLVSGQSSQIVVPSIATTRTRRGDGTAAVTVTETRQVVSNTIIQGTPVIYDGIFRLTYLDRGRDGPAEPVVYLQSKGRNYRLIGVDLSSFADGTRVRVSGKLLVPSSWSASPFFDGDIYVQTIVSI